MAVPAAALVAGRAATSSRRSIGVTLTALLSLVVAVLGPLVAVVVLAALGVASTVGANAAGAWGLPIQPGEFSISDAFGLREMLCTDAGCTGKFHKGQDFGAACGTPVLAVGAGIVSDLGSGGGWGNSVYIDHGDGTTTQYNHLTSINVPAGAAVVAGTQVGTVGETGISFGCHLDLMVITPDGLMDPMVFLRSKGIQI